MSTDTADLRSILRSGTGSQHQKLDEAISALNISGREQYGSFLRLNASIVLPLEEWLENNSVERELSDWPDRRRSQVLVDDLETMEIDVPVPESISFDNSPAAKIGILYVIEGSRLGGRVLAAKLNDKTPAKFLLHGKGKPLWPIFLAWLGAKNLSADDTQTALDAATGLFDLYFKVASNLETSAANG